MAVKMHEVKSSNIESVGHDGDHLHVKFKGSDTYVYEDVPKALFTTIRDADSPGAALHEHIKGKFKHRKASDDD